MLVALKIPGFNLGRQRRRETAAEIRPSDKTIKESDVAAPRCVGQLDRFFKRILYIKFRGC